jgi:hypothetical protein
MEHRARQLNRKQQFDRAIAKSDRQVARLCQGAGLKSANRVFWRWFGSPVGGKQIRDKLMADLKEGRVQTPSGRL